MFPNAPDPVLIAGSLSVPIDIESVSAVVVCDTAAAAATVQATMEFRTSDAGRPLFDLRQSIDSAELDGTAISVSDLAHVTLNGNSYDRMRRIERNLPANSAHTLNLSYTLATPSSQGAQPLVWHSSPRGLRWDFWFSDLFAGRYLEMWLPSNLVYDEFALSVELELQAAQNVHTVITNANMTVLGAHHWLLSWPATTSAFSPLLVLEPSSALESVSPTVTVPGIGTMTLELHRQTSVPTSMVQLQSALIAKLTDFASNVGAYGHGQRFTVLLWNDPSRSMEYSGATTTRFQALGHEVFHSWYARGVKPARQCDSWLDEAWTVWLADEGGTQVSPFSSSDPPVTLRYADQWRRDTPGAAYGSGSRFFAGLADELGSSDLIAFMRDFYNTHIDEAVTTEQLAAYLIRRSGRVDLIDFFHRYVYGFGDSVGADLFLKDSPSDLGTSPTSGVFWRSPDVWVRNGSDGGTSHQNPEAGQDNWLYARVHNRGPTTARLFTVTFAVKTWAGTQFVYPGDWRPAVACLVEGDLTSGSSRVVRARWPSASIPPTGTHGCLLASVYTPDDSAPPGTRVWEHDNLAQRNLTVVDLIPGDSYLLATRLGSAFAVHRGVQTLELRRPEGAELLEVALTHPEPATLRELIGVQRRPPTPITKKGSGREFAAGGAGLTLFGPAEAVLGATGQTELGNALRLSMGAGSIIGQPGRRNDARASIARPVSKESGLASVRFAPGRVSHLSLNLAARQPLQSALRVTAPLDSKPGQIYDVDLIQRDERGRAVGGIGIRVRILRPRRADASLA